MTETEGVQITGPAGDRYDEILTDEALGLVAAMHRELAPRRAQLLAARTARQQELINGATLDFLPATRPVRDDSSWRVAPPARRGAARGAGRARGAARRPGRGPRR